MSPRLDLRLRDNPSMLLDAYYNRNSKLNGIAVNAKDLKAASHANISKMGSSTVNFGEDFNAYEKSRITPSIKDLGV